MTTRVTTEKAIQLEALVNFIASEFQRVGRVQDDAEATPEHAARLQAEIAAVRARWESTCDVDLGIAYVLDEVIHGDGHNIELSRDDLERVCRDVWRVAQAGPRAVLQQVTQALGPRVSSDIDYTDPGNAAGLTADVSEALRLLRAAGIEFKRRGDR